MAADPDSRFASPARAAMKIWGVSMVRNEADIVETFVRHNLAVLDGLIVVDHASADGTLDILKSLALEGLPLAVKRVDVPGYLQAEITTSAAREAFGRRGADAVIALDADEFLKVPSRAALERAIAAIPRRHCARIAWPTYVPPLDRVQSDIVALIRSARRLAVEPEHPTDLGHKVLLTRDFATDLSANLTMGNHGVVLGSNVRTSPQMPHVHLPESTIAVCHLPVRSETQFVVKVAVKRLARVAAGRDYPQASSIWQAWEAIRRGARLTPALMLTSHVAGHHAPAGNLAAEAIATIDEPFLADIALRYTSATAADPLPLVLSAVEGLARRLAAARDARRSTDPPSGAATGPASAA
jgi:Glycosyl transferase family 2